MDGLDRQQRQITVAPTLDETGQEIIPKRSFHYDTLVIAVGSVSNDFGIKGVKQHCLFLDTLGQARKFQQQLLDKMLYMNTHQLPAKQKLNIAVIGGGATGVELAAQLHQVTRQLSVFGLDEVKPEENIAFSLIQAAPRILPELPDSVADKVREGLSKLGVTILENERVVEVTKNTILTSANKTLPADIAVWAAGIKAPEFLKKLDGLESNSTNQLVTSENLLTTRDENIFAMGDCAACPDRNGGNVPPRAQAAHQQASFIAKAITNRLSNKPFGRYRYKDYGSLVTLGRYSTVGSLMGSIPGSIFITGIIAKTVYLSLHKMHEVALYGWIRTFLLTLSKLLRHSVDPEVKLH